MGRDRPGARAASHRPPRIASWPFVDGWFAAGDDMVQSTIKIRQAGFGDCVDTHVSFLENLAMLRDLSLIP